MQNRQDRYQEHPKPKPEPEVKKQLKPKDEPKPKFESKSRQIINLFDIKLKSMRLKEIEYNNISDPREYMERPVMEYEKEILERYENCFRKWPVTNKNQRDHLKCQNCFPEIYNTCHNLGVSS